MVQRGHTEPETRVPDALSRAAPTLYDPVVKIPLDEVRRIARLAHLRFEESELPLIADQLSKILTSMESLSRVDTAEIEPTFHSLEHGVPFREDLPKPSLSRDEATRGAPGGVPGQFVVPRIVG